MAKRMESENQMQYLIIFFSGASEILDWEHQAGAKEQSSIEKGLLHSLSVSAVE